MGEETIGGLDDLMLGNASEGVRESDEKFRERVAAAQAKLTQIHKDESKSKNFDKKLAKIIPQLHAHTLKFVVLLIDNNIPSLTILAVISLLNKESHKICHTEFAKFIEEKADFSSVQLDSKRRERISVWWTYIFAADHVSSTTKFQEFEHNDSFQEIFILESLEMLKQFLIEEKIESQNFDNLKKNIQKYQKTLFSRV
jgi:glutaredoxin-related protein